MKHWMMHQTQLKITAVVIRQFSHLEFYQTKE